MRGAFKKLGRGGPTQLQLNSKGFVNASAIKREMDKWHFKVRRDEALKLRDRDAAMKAKWKQQGIKVYEGRTKAGKRKTLNAKIKSRRHVKRPAPKKRLTYSRPAASQAEARRRRKAQYESNLWSMFNRTNLDPEDFNDWRDLQDLVPLAEDLSNINEVMDLQNLPVSKRKFDDMLPPPPPEEDDI